MGVSRKRLYNLSVTGFRPTRKRRTPGSGPGVSVLPAAVATQGVAAALDSTAAGMVALSSCGPCQAATRESPPFISK